VTSEAGVVDRDGPGLGVVATDLDGDGRVDIFVANDGAANFLFRNLGGLRFDEVGLVSGVASNAQGGYQAGMGVACGDPDGDGHPDLVVTNFYGEGSTFYKNLGGLLFADRSGLTGLLAASRYKLGFGVVFFDFDNGGRLDLATANGHVNDFGPRSAYAMPAQLLAGDRSGRFTDVTASARVPWEVPRVGRGLAAGDLDNDGRVDLVLVGQNESLAFFHNRTGAGHSVTLRLEGTCSNRDAVGALIVLIAGGRRQTAQRTGGGSYNSANDRRIHFGLGMSERVQSVEVHWPSGQTDRYVDLAADTGYILREGDPRPGPLPGFPRRTRAPIPRPEQASASDSSAR
jgi:hypothetical protein